MFLYRNCLGLTLMWVTLETPFNEVHGTCVLPTVPNVTVPDAGQAFAVLLPTVKSVGVMGDHRTYENACVACEQLIVIDRAAHREIIMNLGYDKRQDGGRGLCISKAFPALGIRTRARLEPSEFLPDVSQFLNVSVFPYPLLLWNRGEETVTRHRNPLVDDTLGISMSRTLRIDTLHTLYLGVFLKFCALIWWRLLFAGAFGSADTMDENIEIGLSTFKARYLWWLKKRHELYPFANLTETHEFTKKMVGDPGDLKMGTKGSETWTLLLFLVDEMTYWNFEDKQKLLDAGRSMVALVGIWKAGKWKLKPVEIQPCYRHFKCFMANTDSFIKLHQPTRYLFMHLIRELDFAGNPAYYSTWKDESLNKLLKKTCRTISQLTFNVSVLSSMRELLRMGY